MLSTIKYCGFHMNVLNEIMKKTSSMSYLRMIVGKIPYLSLITSFFYKWLKESE